MTEETKGNLELIGGLLFVIAIFGASLLGMLYQLNNPQLYMNMGPAMPLVQHQIECTPADMQFKHIDDPAHSHLCGNKNDIFIV